MTQYQGNVQSYVLEIQSPNSPYDQKAVISQRDFRIGDSLFRAAGWATRKEPKTRWAGDLRYLLLDGFLAAFHRPTPQREAGAIPVRRF